MGVPTFVGIEAHEMINTNGNHKDRMNAPKDWQQAKAPNFWGAVAVVDHVVQFYEKDEILINALAGFVGDGINCDDACVIIATPEHIASLDNRLKEHGLHIEALMADNRYFPVDAEETLSKFMIDDWPDAPLFFLTISELLAPIKKTGRRVRAFGEMVALLWKSGNRDATLQLEYLWNQFCENEPMSLFCAYPSDGSDDDLQSALSKVCCAHSMVISGSDNQMSEITYRIVER